MSVVQDTSATFHMPAVAGLRRLALRVRDLDAVAGFYTDALGLPARVRGAGRVELAPEGGAFTLELLHAPDAPSGARLPRAQRLTPTGGWYPPAERNSAPAYDRWVTSRPRAPA